MIKVYYNMKSGYLCERYPLDIPVDNNCSYIEIADSDIDQTYSVEYGYSWAVINGKLAIVEVPEIIESAEYKKLTAICKIQEYKQYLSDTDYIISKINEAMIDNEDEANALKEKYSDDLKQRKEYRNKIKELEALSYH